jgi:hypothetical protein
MGVMKADIICVFTHYMCVSYGHYSPHVHCNGVAVSSRVDTSSKTVYVHYWQLLVVRASPWSMSAPNLWSYVDNGTALSEMREGRTLICGS